MPERADNTHHLTAATIRRREAARARAVDAIEDARRLGEPLTLAGAARRAGVSRAYLYSQPDLIAAVRELQQVNGGRPPGIPTQQRASAASLLARIQILTSRNKDLREENRRLRRRLEAAHGRLRDTGAGSVP